MECLRDGLSPPSLPSCPILGELGAEESGVAISSMSEYVLPPFLMLNALPKELLSWSAERRQREHQRIVFNWTRSLKHNLDISADRGRSKLISIMLSIK